MWQNANVVKKPIGKIINTFFFWFVVQRVIGKLGWFGFWGIYILVFDGKKEKRRKEKKKSKISYILVIISWFTRILNAC